VHNVKKPTPPRPLLHDVSYDYPSAHAASLTAYCCRSLQPTVPLHVPRYSVHRPLRPSSWKAKSAREMRTRFQRRFHPINIDRVVAHPSPPYNLDPTQTPQSASAHQPIRAFRAINMCSQSCSQTLPIYLIQHNMLSSHHLRTYCSIQTITISHAANKQDTHPNHLTSSILKIKPSETHLPRKSHTNPIPAGQLPGRTICTIRGMT
jgi:hypothetical protein